MSLPFANNSITVYKYEPFDISWSYPGANSISKTISAGIPSGTVTDLSSTAVRFSSATGLVVPTSSNESIVLRALDGSLNVLATSSNAVTIAPGRFLTDGSLSLDGRVFTFYRNEPTVPTNFFAPFALNGAPLPSPTLPAGLSFVSNSPSNYRLQGTPLLQTPSASYLIIGSNVGGTRFATTRVTISVQPERIALDVSGSTTVGPMQIGTPITQRVVTARCPPYPMSASNVRYSWTQLPLGLEFADSSGTTVSSPYLAKDASSTLILRGTPTYAGAKQFVSLGLLDGASVAVTATRVTTPVISNAQNFTFTFAESVLFDDITIPTLYTNLPLDPSATFVQARTYFGTTDASITTIFSPNLRSDLSLNFVPAQGRAYLTGTPLSAGTASYTFRASNTNGTTQDVSQSIVVLNDSVSLAGPVDVCYNFIVSRVASNAKTGYYPAPIAWTATVASGEPVTFTAPALSGTGLSLSVSGNVATLSGTPTAVTSLRNLRVTATAAVTSASAYKDVSFAVVADQFTFAEDPSWNTVLYQNRAITPVRVSATTLSERSIATYSSSNLPPGVSITNYGVISGTPTTEDAANTFTVVASTAFAVGSKNYSYSVLPDTILFFADPNPYRTTDEGSVFVQLSALSYANSVVSNYTMDLNPSYGLTLNATSGVLSGTLSKTIPDGTTSFTISANAGLHVETLPATLTKSGGTVLIAFDTAPPGGPILLSPSNLNRTLYQYVPIAPLTILASGAPPIRYFVRTTDLPPGIAFNQVTGTFTGKSMERGVRAVTVYAKDLGGLTAIPFVFTTIFPVIVRDGTTTASSYTSLLRQYTVVNAARNAENNVVYPSETQTIGEFARPYPPDETTQTVDPKCYSTSNCP